MKFLRTSWTAITAGILAFLAIFAVASAQRHKRTAEKWQEKAVDIENGNIVKGVKTASQASTQAKLHEQKAAFIRNKAESRINEIAKKDEDISDILSRWGHS